ncbi:hypothetical protein EDD18DRAFT_1099779 [Armillaria luteobubalina]|uniref:Uncharacterized protein n=1 Tax=Armillaria luteobubalina TaxID=153913 RepID=A0AA39UTP4_9AGAR|nr:hypothetical protein IW262DRAFT_1479114 [Armillaria fumosa]KAK0502738.1 hypothetical protein EDD18DRAFT_1099779 [Armillaria luteobubalina]
MARAPLFAVRLATYFMAFAWGAISLSIGLNTVIKQNRLKSFLRRSVAPLGITLRLVTNSVVHPAIASETFCVILCVFSIFTLIGLFVSAASTKTALKAQGFLYAFITVALFACQIPVSDAVRRKGVLVSGTTADGEAVPAATLLQAAASLGVDPLYRRIHFILWFGIIPWIGFLFSGLASIVSFAAVSRVEPPPVMSKAAEAGLTEAP